MQVDPSGRDPGTCALGIIVTLFLTIPSYIALLAGLSGLTTYLLTNFTAVGVGLFAGAIGIGPVIAIVVSLGIAFTIGLIAALILALLPCFRS